jgi:hypothetical protein
MFGKIILYFYQFCLKVSYFIFLGCLYLYSEIFDNFPKKMNESKLEDKKNILGFSDFFILSKFIYKNTFINDKENIINIKQDNAYFIYFNYFFLFEKKNLSHISDIHYFSEFKEVINSLFSFVLSVYLLSFFFMYFRILIND